MSRKLNKTKVTTYLTPETREALKALSERTRLREVDLIQEAVEDLLKKYEREGKRSRA